MHDIFAWLDRPPPLNAADELLPLCSNLAALRDSKLAPEQRTLALQRLFMRSTSALKALLPSLVSVSLPIPRKTRQLIRNLHDLLRTLAEELLSSQQPIGEPATNDADPVQDIVLWRALFALGQHLLVSNLAASPAGTGIWLQLHQAYDIARRHDIAGNTPEGASCSLRQTYYSAVLLGCAQPASFTSSEVDFVVAYLAQFAGLIDLIEVAAIETPSPFWIDPARDAPAVACARKPAPPETPVHYFSGSRIAGLLEEQLAAIEAGASPKQLNLPRFSSTVAGRGAMRRLVTNWGNPGKRRFTRRRQNHRAILCAGLDSLWRLFQNGSATTIETSSWMITNQSPDGYAVMHMAGKTGAMSVGDISAIRTESGADWQICVVRWALSENQEHLELGLQILATQAVPAFLARPSQNSGHHISDHLSVLILPEVPALHSAEMLVVPSGALENQSRNLILIVERENIEVREIRSTHLDEQNSQIEVFSIESATAPD